MRANVAATLTAAAILLAACSTGSHSAAHPTASTSAGPSETVLAIGGSATEGDGVRNRFQEAWPYLVFEHAFPLSAAFVNGALDDATAARALTAQAPLARQLKPAVVEVWVGADDLRASTPIPAFTLSMTQLIKTLRAEGSHRILVADLPAAYGSRAGAYNDAIHSAVQSTGAELVSLANATITLAPVDKLPPQPDRASHIVIATAFERQIANGP